MTSLAPASGQVDSDFPLSIRVWEVPHPTLAPRDSASALGGVRDEAALLSVGPRACPSLVERFVRDRFVGGAVLEEPEVMTTLHTNDTDTLKGLNNVPVSKIQRKLRLMPAEPRWHSADPTVLLRRPVWVTPSCTEESVCGPSMRAPTGVLSGTSTPVWGHRSLRLSLKYSCVGIAIRGSCGTS